MSDNFVRPERIKTALDNKKLNLSAECPSAKGKMSSLTWQFNANAPKIIVYTNDPQDQDKRNDNGRIQAAFGIVELMQFFQGLHEVIDYKGEALPHGFRINNKAYDFSGGKRSDEPVIKSTLLCWKDKDGIIYLSVIAPNRPKIKFPIQSSDWHVFMHYDGTPLTAAEGSVQCAKGYVNFLEGLITNLADSKWVEPKPKQQKDNNWQAGGNKGGYGGNSGGGGGYNRQNNNNQREAEVEVADFSSADIDY